MHRSLTIVNLSQIFPVCAAISPGLTRIVPIMLMSFIALGVLALSALLVLGHLRIVAQDTFAVLRNFTHHARTRGQVANLLAFMALWLLIFSLSYFA